MKKTHGRNHILLLLLILCLFPVVGCSKQDKAANVDSTKFESHDIALNNDSVIVTGKLKLGKEEGILLSVEAKENTKGTFKIKYTKDKGSQVININNKQLLTLKSGEDIESKSIEVDFKRGINDFLLTGDTCSFDYKITLNVEDRSQVKHFRGGTAKAIID